MKKRLKGLVSIWLAVVMVCSMIVPATATEETGEAFLHTGENALNVGDYVTYESPTVEFVFDEPLAEQPDIMDALTAPAENGLTGWKLWRVHECGFVEKVDGVSPENIGENDGISKETYNSILGGGGFAIEPLWAKYRINPQPTKETPTVGGQIYSADDGAFVTFDDVLYQWCDVTVDEDIYTVVETPSEDNHIQGEICNYGVDYGDYVNDKWVGVDAINMAYYELELTFAVQAGDEVKVTLSDDFSGAVNNKAVTNGEYTEIMEYAADYYRLYIASNAVFTATITVTRSQTIYTPLTDQTAATLNLSKIDPGTYACELTFDPDGDNAVMMSDTVTYEEGEVPVFTSIVWVGGQGMTASEDGTVVSYYTNGDPGTVYETDPGQWNAKLYYDTNNSAYTLEINDLDATGIANDADSLGAGIYSTVPLTIDIVGNNTVVGSTNTKNSYGIRAPGLVINGTETATLGIGSADVRGYQDDYSCGIYSEGDVVINTANIKTTGGDATDDKNPGWGVGIYVVGKLIINDSDIEATGTDSGFQSAGIYVVAPASNIADLYYTGGGESSGGGGSTVDPGGEAGTTTAEGGLTINGGKVVATGGRGYYSGLTTAHSRGIFTYGAITIKDADVIATSDYAVEYTSAIMSEQSDITISNSEVTATSGDIIDGDSWTCRSVAIEAANNFTSTDSTVVANSGETTLNTNVAVYVAKDILVSGGTLTVASAPAGAFSYGIDCGNLTIKDGAQVTAASDTAGYLSYGTFVYDNFHMSGDTSSLTTSSGIVEYNTSSYVNRSAGLYLGDDRYEDDFTTDDTFTITGGTLKAWCDTSDAQKADEAVAVGLLDVVEDKFTFFDTEQTNGEWYEWAITSDGQYDPTDKKQSAEDEYIHKNNAASTYLYIGPKADAPITHKVTFDYMDGVTEDLVVQVEDGEKAARPANPTREGYDFGGWFTSADGGETLSDTPYDFNTPVTNSFTLYAKWVPVYTVHYELAGGTGVEGVTYPDQTVTEGTEVTVKPAPGKTGYTFTGWSDGTTPYQPNAKITVNSNITLIAQWEKNDTPIDPDPIPIGTAKLTKVDADDNSKVLSGVVFELYRSAGSLVGTYTTDSNGEIRVGGLLVGNYYWKEVSTAEGYVLDETEYNFTVSVWLTTSLVIENEKSEVPDVFIDDHYAYIIGYDDGLVHPEANITRAEVATIFFRLLDEETRNRYMTRENSFIDVSEDAWYNTAVSTMAAMGIVTGRPGNVFDPNANITRAEFAAIAARFDANGNTTGASFTDIYDHWAMKEINIAANNGWVLGYEDGTFRPDQNITRAEAMTMVNRVLQRIPESVDDLHPDMILWPDNMDTAKWYYLMVQEATNSHDYIRKNNGYKSWIGLRETPDWAAFEQVSDNGR